MLTRGIFVTGTDTGVGKTHVTCLLSTAFQEMGHSVGLYKPVCSGAIREVEREGEPGQSQHGSWQGNWIWEDIEKLAATLPLSTDREMICPQRFIAPLAPPVAASLEGTSVNSMQLRTGANAWLGQVEILLVEGVGGWRSPIATGETVAELARDMKFPVILVAANRLGMINHTLLTLESIRNLSLSPLGIVVNCAQERDDESGRSNANVLREMTGLPVWGPLPWNHSIKEISMIRQIAKEISQSILFGGAVQY